MCDQIAELSDLGLSGTMFRLSWEWQLRSGWLASRPSPESRVASRLKTQPLETTAFRARIPFADTAEVSPWVQSAISGVDLGLLGDRADNAANGIATCFGSVTCEVGSPPRWHRDPITGIERDPSLHWTRALAERPEGSDIRYLWELGRFGQAYDFGRAATFIPGRSSECASAFASQLTSFVLENPSGFGVHWASGQEVALRMIAWAFAAHTLELAADTRALLATQMLAGASYIADHISYARRAVHNNHLISEAAGLALAAAMFPGYPDAPSWRSAAAESLDEVVSRQFASDGGYTQNSHSYHRMALQVLIAGARFLGYRSDNLPPPWRSAISSSVDFLSAHQCASSGQLPNSGANDSSLPLVLSTCARGDFRPTLQAASVFSRGERLYDHGPWDEEAVWLHGKDTLDLPRPRRECKSASFAVSGYHVLRGTDADTFACLRAGSVRSRFSQIDMLHLDVWWRGINVLADAGSYSYNLSSSWHNHFMRTSAHNTVEVDGQDQMVHYRPFKCLYWTEAALLRFEETADSVTCEGEHYGYRRLPGHPVHRRSVLAVKEGLWVVVDTVLGEGRHTARLHWLCGVAGVLYDVNRGLLTLETSQGPFTVSTFDIDGRVLAGDVEEGQATPPRGWLSRTYSQKTPVASLVVSVCGSAAVSVITVLAAAAPEVHRVGANWTVNTPDHCVQFRLDRGRFAETRVQTNA